MINKLKNISNEGADSAVAETAPQTRATGAAPSLESSRTQPPAAALTAHEIGETIAANWTFAGTDSPEAQQLYVSWADAGITLDALHAAMTGVEEDENCFDPTPAHLVPRLWPLVVDGFTSQLSV